MQTATKYFIKLTEIIQQLLMNKSNTFSQYMVTNSGNRSTNFSPTSGRVHKQKEKGTFGPTICLLNRSREIREDIIIQTSTVEPYLERILLLTMEIERLNDLVKRLGERQKSSNFEINRQIIGLKDTNQKHKMTITMYQSQHIQNEKRFKQQIIDLKEQVSLIEAQNRSLVRRLKDSQRQVDELRRKRKETELVVQKNRLQASRMQMSMQFNTTSADLHKSIAREKNLEIDTLRQKINRCEDIINDQKFLINNQKEELSKERLKHIEIQKKFEIQIQYLKQQVEYKSRELSVAAQQQVKHYLLQIRELQAKILKFQEQIKSKSGQLEMQNRVIIDHEDKIIELQRKNNDLDFTYHTNLVRSEENGKLTLKQKEKEIIKLQREIEKYMQENQNLKLYMQQYKESLQRKEVENQKLTHETTRKLLEKQHQVRRLTKKTNLHSNVNLLSETKLNKSRSLDNIVFTNRLKSTNVDLQKIVNCVMDLKTSNEKSSKLIGKSFNATIAKQLYYAK